MTNGLTVEQKSIVKVPNKKLPNSQNITLYKCYHSSSRVFVTKDS